MSVSRFNNWNAPLAGFGSPGDNFNGSPEATGAAACISVVILCSTQTTLKVEQNRSINNPFIFEDEYTIQPGVQTTIQVRVVLPYFRVNIINDTMTTQTYMNMNTMLLTELTRNVDIRPLTAATDSVNVDVSGVILPVQGTVAVNNFPAIQTITGTVAVSSQPHLSYLTDNVAVATMPAITGTVAVSSQPYLSYLTDNVAVATMPAITGTVAVSSQPYLSYLTDNVAVATMPAITGTVAVSSQPHLSYLTDNVAVATMPAITGSVSVSNFPAVQDISGTVSIGTALPTGNNIIGKVITFENPSSVISLNGIGTTGQTIKDSAGSLFNITVFNDGNAIAYLKIYDVAVPTASDTPVITLPVLHDSPINSISIHNYQFPTAIGVRATANYIANDTTAPNGNTTLTAFFNGVLP